MLFTEKDHLLIKVFRKERMAGRADFIISVKTYDCYETMLMLTFETQIIINTLIIIRNKISN